ncbi:hypothetical protein ABPG73_005893 [Tetrahymena malaccensis]
MEGRNCSTHFKDPKWREAYLEEVMKQEQSEKYRGPVPGEGVTYPVDNWFDFQVLDSNKKPLKLHTYKYPAEGKRVAVFVIFHGLNSHVGRSAHIAQALSQSGIESVGFDYRGFGKSEGARGVNSSHTILMEDVEKFLKHVEEVYKGEKIFIGGQSWGGQICYSLTLNNPNRFAGVIMYAPAIKDNKKNSPFGKMIACAIGALFPSMQTIEQKHGFANKNPAVSESFPKDPQSYTDKIIPSTVRNVINQQEVVSTTYKQYKAPFLIFTAGVDKLVDPLLGYDLMDESPSLDKTHVFYENCWHNMWGEIEIYSAIEKTKDWILKRI